MTSINFRIGIDLGGTKIEAVALGADGNVAMRERIATPAGYEPTLSAIAGLVGAIEQKLGGRGSVGGGGGPGGGGGFRG